ncbi:MAG: peptidylprolyl isomerase [Bacteroidota bacterium]
MKIEQNSVVSVTYNLKAGIAGSPVEEIESVDESNPLVFIFGSGMMIPGFETNLNGLSNGDTFSFSIQPEEAYGSADATAVIKLPIEIFKVDNVIDFEVLKTGNILPMSDNEGNMLRGKVLGFDDKEVTMDFNHPLAGMDLHFTGSVVGVRPATIEELAHGHVHGQGGVEH